MMSELNALFETQVSSVTSNMVRDNAFRLDASAYRLESRSWSVGLSKFQVVRLDEIADVKQPIIFGKRSMTGSKERGIPLYSSSQMLMHDPEPAFFLSRRFEKKLNKSLTVFNGWTLVSRTGTVGNTVYVTEDRDGMLVDDHMIRIIPTHTIHRGLIYTFLSSPPGKAILNRLIYGAVQDVIKEFQVAGIDIPILEDQIVQAINESIGLAAKKRVEAATTLKQADSLVHELNALSQLREKDAIWLDKRRKVISARIFSKDVIRDNHSGSEYRLDAHFYNPLAQLAIENIKKAKTEVKTIGDVAERVFMCNRSSRNYVASKYGMPYLSGKNIVQIRPTGLKYVSIAETWVLEELKLKEGWTLITRAGSIGRACFVWKNYENFAASDNILRVIPDKNLIDPGYLYAFLSSQYGQVQIQKHRVGSVIDFITEGYLKMILIPLPAEKGQKQIGDLVRSAYEKRADAIRLEDEAQEILMEALTQ